MSFVSMTTDKIPAEAMKDFWAEQHINSTHTYTWVPPYYPYIPYPHYPYPGGGVCPGCGRCHHCGRGGPSYPTWTSSGHSETST